MDKICALLQDHNDTVTYAAIRWTENEPQDELYKNKSFTNKHYERTIAAADGTFLKILRFVSLLFGSIRYLYVNKQNF